MLQKLQKKFISISALGLFLMILLVMLSVDGAYFYQTNRLLAARLSMLIEEQAPQDLPENNDGNDVQNTPPTTLKDAGQDPQPNAKENPNAASGMLGTSQDMASPEPGMISQNSENLQIPPQENDGLMKFPGFSSFTENLRIQSDGCLVLLNENGEVQEIAQDAAMRYDEDEISDVAESIFANGKASGWHSYFKYRLDARDNTDGTVQYVVALVNASSDLYSLASVIAISLLIGAISFVLVLLIIVFASKRAVKPVAESYTKQKQFVTDAGHELKTPLTVISASNELSRMLYGDSEWFDSIDKQVARMNGLIKNLIELAKMDEERKPEFAPFNLSDAVDDTVRSFAHLIHAKEMLLTFDIEENIRYIGEEAKLRELVSILIDNASKYCDPKGKIAVHLKSGKQIKLQVVNDFQAASTCKLDQVFERFYRADKARSSDGSYGLGLSIAKAITELHGGTIVAKALGTDRVVFEVTLPKR